LAVVVVALGLLARLTKLAVQAVQAVAEDRKIPQVALGLAVKEMLAVLVITLVHLIPVAVVAERVVLVGMLQLQPLGMEALLLLVQLLVLL
jgi:hypothetical protein